MPKTKNKKCFCESNQHFPYIAMTALKKIIEKNTKIV